MAFLLVVGLGAKYGDIHGLLLARCSRITPGGAEDQTVGYMQGKQSISCTISL